MTSDASKAPPTAPAPSTNPTASPSLPAPSPVAPHHSPHPWAVWCAAGVVALVVGYFGIHGFSHRLSNSITDDAFVEAHIVNVAPEMVSGRIVRFLVEENDQVVQGQVLAEIEPVHYRDQVAQARGKLELADAELKRQQAGLAKLRKEVPLQIDVAKETLAGARIEEARAKDNLKLTTNEVARTIDEAKPAIDLAKANL